MARYRYARGAFVGGGLIPVGTIVDSIAQPPKAVPVPRDPGFILSPQAGQTWGLPRGVNPADKSGHDDAVGRA